MKRIETRLIKPTLKIKRLLALQIELEKLLTEHITLPYIDDEEFKIIYDINKSLGQLRSYLGNLIKSEIKKSETIQL